MKKFLPLVGVLMSAVLFALAAARYPGGYQWAHHYISMLLRPMGAEALDNPSRPMAVAAMFLLCVSVGVVFVRISRRARSRFQKTTIEIAGPASMVYAFLTVTPLHDLMVTISVVFFFAALLAALHGVLLERRFALFAAGCVAFASIAVCSMMYYGDVLTAWMPIAQKLTFLLCVAWLLALDLSQPTLPEGSVA